MIPIYVISVKSFSERHKHIEQMAERFGFLFEYVWQYDADELNETDLRRVGGPLGPKSASNVLKHLLRSEILRSARGLDPKICRESKNLL